MRRASFVCLVLGCGMLALVDAGSMSAQEEPALQFRGGDAARTVELERGPRGGQALGKLVLTVVNRTRASGALAVEFESTGDRTTVSTEPPDPAIPSRRTKRVDVTFRVFAGDDGVPKLSGTLTAAFVEEQGVGPAVADVTGTTASPAKFVSKSVEFTATDWWGPLRWFDGRDESRAVSGHADVSLRNAQRLNEDPVASSRLAAGGDEIGILLRRPIGAGNGLWRARADVDDVEHAGEYKGSLSLDPSNAEASALEATVKVTDFFLWPIAAIVLGAVVAWLLKVYVYERVIARWRLRRSLQDAIERYDAVVAKTPKRVANLDRWLGPPGDQRRYGCDPAVLEFAQAYCAAENAKGQEALEAARKKSAELVATIDRWVALVAALDGLAEATKTLPARDELNGREAPLIEKDSEGLMYGPLDASSDAAVRTFEERVESQTSVVIYFVAAWKARKELEELLKKQPAGAREDARKALKDCDPRKVYDDAARADERTPQQSEALLGRLDHCVRTLRWHRDELAPPKKPERRRRAVPARETAALPDEALVVLIDELGSTDEVDAEAVKRHIRKRSAAKKPAKRRPVPSASQLATGLRVRESLVFGAVTFISAAVYFVTTLTGRPFGSATDYALAFGAGFAGKVALERVPGFSSEPSEGDGDKPAGDSGTAA